MAKIQGPLFSMKASGSLGDLVFDKRGFVRLKADRTDPKSASQGNFRQALSAAQHCVKLCGPNTRDLLKAVVDEPARWHTDLVKTMLGPERSAFQATIATYGNGTVERDTWETAAIEAGLREVNLGYAAEGAITPGAQLFMLASSLFELTLYESLGHPAGNGTPNPNVADWRDNIRS